MRSTSKAAYIITNTTSEKHILERMPFDHAVSGEMWIGCTMRKWLNETFLHEAFTDEEIHCIQISKNTMDESDLYDDAVPYKCTTFDKVFALSQEEICKMSERYQLLCVA